MTFDPEAAFGTLTSAQRINVTGNAGVGKSTVARALGAKLGLPVVHLDHLIWAPGWQRVPLPTRNQSVARVIAEPSWVIDGVSESAREQAEVVVFIDLPTRVALYRVLRRAVILLNNSRPEMGKGFPELRAVRPAFRLARRFNRHIRPAMIEHCESLPQVIHLTSAREVTALLELLPSAIAQPPACVECEQGTHHDYS